MSGKSAPSGPIYNYGTVPGGSPAADPEYEQARRFSRDDRKAMLRRHFEKGGMTEEQIDAAMSKAKV